MQHDTETLTGGTVVWTNATHRIGSDSLRLAEFCEVKPGWSACDIGSGCGILLLSLIDKGLRGRAVGIEIDPGGSALLKGAAEANQYPFVEAVTQDIATFKTTSLFDIVVANPPYYNEGAVPPDVLRATARHELRTDIWKICSAAGRILKQKGRFYLCWPAARMATLFSALQQNQFAPKRMRLVRPAADSNAFLILMDARLEGGEGLTVLPDWII